MPLYCIGYSSGMSYWAKSGSTTMKKDLTIQAKHWLNFACSCLISSINDTKIAIHKEILVASTFNHILINLGEIIGEEIKKCARQNET